MAASAGRVLLIPKGTYNAAITYNMLDVVYYNGGSYVCKQTSLNNLPTDTDYWQLLVSSSGTAAQVSFDPTGTGMVSTNVQNAVVEVNNKKSERTDITSIIATGSTNTTGAQIPNGAYFYLNGVLCRATANIATSATFTKNTNYVETSVGSEIGYYEVARSSSSGTHKAKLNELYSAFNALSTAQKTRAYITFVGDIYHIVSSAGYFSKMRVNSVNSATNTMILDSSNSEFHQGVQTTSGYTYSDISSNSNSEVMILYTTRS